MKTKLEILKIREKVIDAIREFLKKEKFLEVTTPILVSSLAAEPYLEIFETTLLDPNRIKSKKYLITSPEVGLKKLLCFGIGSCFEITKSFRNMESQSRTHNPEFTILEWYRVGADYMDVMRDVENLILYIDKRIPLRQKINLSPPWPRMTIRDACLKHANFDLNNAFEFDEMKKIFLQKGYKFEKSTTWEQMFNQIFINEVENEIKKTSNPIILYDYPSDIAMLAKKKKDNPHYDERFELYIGGLELADAYSDLQNTKQQEDRFKSSMQLIKSQGKTEYPIDKEFLNLLKNPGLPKCSGIAVGIDRLVMLFAGCENIQEAI